ncbi:DUF309 domain-containing protein [Peribacillus loiseleuriae]|uniref:DUF309 domain-containing protein n=1 Tax=Peribacillus loiseleuriae TaxID=1679170 RepID=A0A0K9GVD1_9BACI|nr:DUF309 domain-containing protein [Peribacillus loiseleuriae]KMY50649.1 hypothetical protein AC625_14975 [Peribacillus loiseleuriae]
MCYPKEYVSYLVHFHASRDYFECHEILEEYWKEVSPRERDSYWVGFIQIAVALYHYRRGNLAGAIKTIRKADSILQMNPAQIRKLGIEYDELMELIHDITEKITLKKPYQSVSLPICDKKLIEACLAGCREAGYRWMKESDLNDSLLINRHVLRDRSEVITERNKQLQIRKTKND